MLGKAEAAKADGLQESVTSCGLALLGSHPSLLTVVYQWGPQHLYGVLSATGVQTSRLGTIWSYSPPLPTSAAIFHFQKAC